MTEKKILLMGLSRDLKRRTAELIEDKKIETIGNQVVVSFEKTMICPDAYLENPGLFNRIIVLAQDAACIAILVDTKQERQKIPPNFAGAFEKPVIGIGTRKGSAERDDGSFSRIGIREDRVFYPLEDDSEETERFLECISKIRKGSRDE